MLRCRSNWFYLRAHNCVMTYLRSAIAKVTL
jgi:hypothetical protein